MNSTAGSPANPTSPGYREDNGDSATPTPPHAAKSESATKATAISRNRNWRDDIWWRKLIGINWLLTILHRSSHRNQTLAIIHSCSTRLAQPSITRKVVAYQADRDSIIRLGTAAASQSMQHGRRIWLTYQLGIKVEVEIQSPIRLLQINLAGHEKICRVMIALRLHEPPIKFRQFRIHCT